MSDAASFPSWVLLEPFVFRRDDDESFPDETKAPIRATGTTSWDARFRIAFCLAEPPLISRLYAQLPVPGFPDRRVGDPLAIVATHRHLAQLRVATETPASLTVQDFFIYNAEVENPSTLKALPAYTEPSFRHTGGHGRRPTPDESPRLLAVTSMGLWCQGNKFVVAELTVQKPDHSSKVIAHICLLRSCTTSAEDELGGTWSSTRANILCNSDNPDDDDIQQLSCWQTDAVIPFRRWLCWVDYNHGILFCDVSKEPTPSVSFLRFPLHEFPHTITHATASSFLYRGVSVVDHGHTLKFVNVARHDGFAVGALKPSTGFTITCHTLVLGGGGMAWKEDYTVTSSELWEANPAERLPRGILMFPRVDIDRPHAVHFLFVEFGFVNKKMWVVSIDMSTKTVEPISLYRWEGWPQPDPESYVAQIETKKRVLFNSAGLHVRRHQR